MIRLSSLGASAPRDIIATQLANANEQSSVACVCVGDDIEQFDDNTLRGHGTQVTEETLQATVCGVVDRVNKLVTVRPLHRRYVAEIGDVVVGRVTEVVAKRWRVDLQSRQEAHLLLSAVSLPGGVQRRRTAEDELNMRSVFREGDLVSAEVQSIHHDGTVMLHTRSAKYGRLEQGRVVRVPAELVKRQRHHFQTLESVGVMMILGCNGLVWVTHRAPEPAGDSGGASEAVKPEPTPEQREAVARVCQAMAAMAQLGLALQGAAVARVVALSVARGVAPRDIAGPDFLAEVAADEEAQRQEAAIGMDTS